MDARDRSLVKVRITDVSEIQVGMPVAYVSTPAELNNGKALLTRGFIRSIHNGRARIGNYTVAVDVDVIKYRLVQP